MKGTTPTARRSKPLIYVVDDEPMLLEMIDLALRQEGYTLKKFDSPETAFEALAADPEKPSLLLTDYAMDSMNGIELSTKCKHACPDLKVLIISGTAGPELIVNSPVKVDSFLAKPYRAAELAKTVRSLLAQQTP